jgi:putative methionine-R-sulfoxide reductase with GAF domain
MQNLLKPIRELIAGHTTAEEGLQAVAKLLRAEIPHYNWVGIYLVQDGKLVLAAWDGPEATEHTEIDIGQGICGLAAREKRTILVDDVHAEDQYLACFPQTRSEIVVPLMRGAECIGEIDIDSDTPSAFSASDREFLEVVARLLVDAYFAS